MSQNNGGGLAHCPQVYTAFGLIYLYAETRMRQRNSNSSVISAVSIAVVLQFSILMDSAIAEPAKARQRTPIIAAFLVPPNSGVAAPFAPRQSLVAIIRELPRPINVLSGAQCICADVENLPDAIETRVICDRSPPNGVIALQ